MATQFQADTGTALKEVKVRGWELDAKGKVRAIEPITGDPPHEYFILSSDRTGVVLIDEKNAKKPALEQKGYFSYDERKRAICSIWKDRFDRVTTSFYYSYDERGCVTKREEKSKTGRILYTTECRCDTQGSLVEEKYYKAEEYLGRNVYTRDSAGRIVTEAHYDKNDVNSGRYAFTYDSAGRCTSRAWHNIDGDLMSIFHYRLDDKGNRIRSELHRKGAIEAVQEFTYDECGNMVEERWLDADGNVIRKIIHS